MRSLNLNPTEAELQDMVRTYSSSLFFIFIFKNEKTQLINFAVK